MSRSNEKPYRRPPPQEPVATTEHDPMGGTTYEHPAFACISANRVSGNAVLYGSDFVHQHYVTIRIARSRLRRTLSNDWHHGDSRPYIEVKMSEAQWAHFVSAMNVGSGTQCTLYSRNGEDIPGLVEPVDRRAQFAAEADERMQRAVQALKDAAEAVRESGLSQKKQQALLGALDRASANIGCNLKFVADQFSEHMERTVEQAKSEVDGYIAGATRQLGLAAMHASTVIGIEPPRFAFPSLPSNGKAEGHAE